MKQIITIFLLSIGISFLSLNEFPASVRLGHKVSFKEYKNTFEKFLDSIEVEFQEDISDENSSESLKPRGFLGLNLFFQSLLSRNYFLFPKRLFTIQLFKLYHNYRI